MVAAKELDRNLLVGSWNLRAFGGLTKKWQSADDDSPKRDLADVMAIAAVLSRFDVVAVQEVRSDLRALRHLLKALGPDWGFTLTDVTRGPAGNDERMAFLFDTRRVSSWLACEIVMPEGDPRVSPAAFARQFARTPYAVSFTSAGKTFILVTLHVVYGKAASDRVGELTAIAQWLAGWANEAAEWGTTSSASATSTSTAETTRTGGRLHRLRPHATGQAPRRSSHSGRHTLEAFLL